MDASVDQLMASVFVTCPTLSLLLSDQSVKLDLDEVLDEVFQATPECSDPVRDLREQLLEMDKLCARVSHHTFRTNVILAPIMSKWGVSLTQHVDSADTALRDRIVGEIGPIVKLLVWRNCCAMLRLIARVHESHPVLPCPATDGEDLIRNVMQVLFGGLTQSYSMGNGIFLTIDPSYFPRTNQEKAYVRATMPYYEDFYRHYFELTMFTPPALPTYFSVRFPEAMLLIKTPRDRLFALEQYNLPLSPPLAPLFKSFLTRAQAQALDTTPCPGSPNAFQAPGYVSLLLANIMAKQYDVSPSNLARLAPFALTCIRALEIVLRHEPLQLVLWSAELEGCSKALRALIPSCARANVPIPDLVLHISLLCGCYVRTMAAIATLPFYAKSAHTDSAAAMADDVFTIVDYHNGLRSSPDDAHELVTAPHVLEAIVEGLLATDRPETQMLGLSGLYALATNAPGARITHRLAQSGRLAPLLRFLKPSGGIGTDLAKSLRHIVLHALTGQSIAVDILRAVADARFYCDVPRQRLRGDGGADDLLNLTCMTSLIAPYNGALRHFDRDQEITRWPIHEPSRDMFKPTMDRLRMFQTFLQGFNRAPACALLPSCAPPILSDIMDDVLMTKRLVRSYNLGKQLSTRLGDIVRRRLGSLSVDQRWKELSASTARELGRLGSLADQVLEEIRKAREKLPQ